MNTIVEQTRRWPWIRCYAPFDGPVTVRVGVPHPLTAMAVDGRTRPVNNQWETLVRPWVGLFENEALEAFEEYLEDRVDDLLLSRRAEQSLTGQEP